MTKGSAETQPISKKEYIHDQTDMTPDFEFFHQVEYEL
jgi:hypothetical protein